MTRSALECSWFKDSLPWMCGLAARSACPAGRTASHDYVA